MHVILPQEIYTVPFLRYMTTYQYKAEKTGHDSYTVWGKTLKSKWEKVADSRSFQNAMADLKELEEEAARFESQLHAARWNCSDEDAWQHEYKKLEEERKKQRAHWSQYNPKFNPIGL